MDAKSRRLASSFGAMALVALVLAAAAASGHAGSPQKPGPAYVLGVSSMLVGVGWNEALICAIKAQARASGKVARVIVANRRGGPEEQISDLRRLIASGVNAIIVNPTSPSALNAAIGEAVAEGIQVVSVDQRVTAPQAHNVTNDQVLYGRIGAEWLFEQLGGKGNVVEMRGIRGTQVDLDRHAGFVQALRRFPGIKVVRSVYTLWQWEFSGQTMLQLLRSGARVDGVWTSGVDYPVVNAFREAGLPLVPIVGTDTTEFLRQLLQLRAEGWRSAVVTNSATIGGVGAAMAIRLLDGARVPRSVELTPELWDSGTASGLARIKENYSPKRPATYSARQQIKPWTSYTRQQLFACRNVG